MKNVASGEFVINSFFIATSTISECPITSYGLFQSANDASMLTNFTVFSIIDGDNVGTSKLIINRNNPSQGEQVYIRAMTSSGKKDWKEINIKICGFETVLVSQPSLELTTE
jgi:hypothetical protein